MTQVGPKTPFLDPTACPSEHRPWPLPQGPWRWRQKWLDLGFIHHRVDPAILRPRLPPALEIDTFDGTGWVSLVPFTMAELGFRSWPSLPTMGIFPELNVRTYVKAGGKPGVWFFSLDADCLAMVAGARALYALPYHRARMSRGTEAGAMAFASRRCRDGIRFRARFSAHGPVFAASSGSLEEWLTERYCLYAARGKVIRRLEVHHSKWSLQAADFEIEENELFDRAGITPLSSRPICHFSKGVDVVTFTPQIVD